MRGDGRPQRVVRGTALVVAVLVGSMFGGLALAGTASAHGDEGEMTVITAEPAGPLEVRLLVGILYSNDDEPATEATVTVTGVGPDGNTMLSKPLPREEGAKYGTTLTGLANGPWTFTITSTEPEAEATATVVVEVDQSSSTTTPEATTTTEAATTTAPVTTTSLGISPDDDDAAASQGDQDDSNTATIAVIALAVLAAVVGGGVYLRSRRSAGPGPDDGA